MKRTDINDFSAGLYEVRSPADFSEKQSAQLRGYVLQDEQTLRSQGAVQKIGTSGFSARQVWGYRGAQFAYLIALSDGGQLYWTTEPDKDTNFIATRLKNWTPVGNPPNANLRSHTTFSYKPSELNGEEVSAILFADIGTGPAVVLYEVPSGSGFTLSSKLITNHYPHTTTIGTGDDAVDEPDNNIMPRHSVATTWADFLVIGDVYWSSAGARDNNMSEANVKRYPNYVWFAYPTDATKWGLLPVRAAEPGSTIVGLQAVAEGLLVITTTSNGQTGITLLQGDPSLVIDGQAPTYRYVTLFPGQGTPPGFEVSQRGRIHTYWPALDSTIFIDALGQIQQIRNKRIGRIDRVCTYNTGVVTSNQGVAAVGEWLFAIRNDRFLCMKSFGGAGAWTELAAPLPQGGTMVPLGACLYYVSEGDVWRYITEDQSGNVNERGCVDGEPQILYLGTRTLGDPNDTQWKFWDYATIFLYGKGQYASVKDVRSLGGALLDRNDVDSYLETVDASDTDTFTGPRFLTVNLHGDSRWSSILMVGRGDITVEQISVFWDFGQMEQ